MSSSDKWRQARRRDLSASRPAEAGSSQAKPGDPRVPGKERRARLKDPAAAGEGRHSLWPCESSTEAGEERQVGRRKDGRGWPDDPEPRDGDGEGTRSRGEESQDGRVGEDKVWPEPEPGEGDLRGDGEGTRSRGEKYRSGIHRRPKPAMVGYWRLTLEPGYRDSLALSLVILESKMFVISFVDLTRPGVHKVKPKVWCKYSLYITNMNKFHVHQCQAQIEI